MAKKNKTAWAGAGEKSQRFLAVRLKKVNGVINRFEQEVEHAVRRVREQSKRSSENLVKIFDELIETVGATELKNKALEKKDELMTEIKRISDEIVTNIRDFEFSFDASLIERAKQALIDAARALEQSEILEYAKGMVSDGKNQIFTYLQIPSQAEVDSLARKLVSLEKKLKVVSKHNTAKAA